MGTEKTVPRKAINKKTKTKVVFDENARKEFLTGFRKRKDERRKQWKEKIDRQLKNEIQKIKNDTKSKLEQGGMSKKNSSHQIVPEVAHLINSDAAQTLVKDIGGASVSITTLDSLKKAATPWHDNANRDDTSEEEEDESEEEEEVPGMSLKQKKAKQEVVPFQVGEKEKKAINRMAVSQLHKSKAFKAKEALKAKKQRNAARWKKGKKEGKRKQHAKKFAKPKEK